MLHQLEDLIGYKFKDLKLLEKALTHSSCDLKEAGRVYDNERLEFLGDRVLSLVIAGKLFTEYCNDREGMLAKRHTALVRKETLADIALEKWHLNEYIRMSDGEKQTGGQNKPSILSDAAEALIAAVFLDSSYEEAEAFVLKHWNGVTGAQPLKDAKSKLQEWLQKRKLPLPHYDLVDTLGDAHDATFIMRVFAETLGTAEGEGPSKQQAQQNAAQELLKRIEK